MPEVVTSGDTLEEALRQAPDAMEAAIAFRMAKGEALPNASAVLDDEHAVALPAPVAAKAAVYGAWREAGMSNRN